MTDVVLRELCQAARFMSRAPGVSTAVVLTLALGIGASTAIISLATACCSGRCHIATPSASLIDASSRSMATTT